MNSKAGGLPLHKYLGAFELESVPAYASGGYYLDGKTPEKLGEEMASYVELGFKAVKMKTGRHSPKEEEARLKAARAAVGPDVELMMDCNNAWQDTTQRSEEHTSELQSLMRISYAVFCLKTQNTNNQKNK